ncbi:MAG: hypothetical protein JXA60_04395 [Candidatus Coatesbacteria bacterium]|nr:hypothetical protein [Candidatus Coatesbacteria bacterium]
MRNIFVFALIILGFGLLSADAIDLGPHGGMSFGYKNPTNPDEKLELAPSVGFHFNIRAAKVLDFGGYFTYTHLGKYPFTMKDFIERYMGTDMENYFNDFFKDQSNASQFNQYMGKYGFSYEQFQQQGFDGFKKYMEDRMAEMGNDTLMMVNYHEIGIGIDVRKRFPLPGGVVQPFIGAGGNVHFQTSDDQMLSVLAQTQTGTSSSFSAFKLNTVPGMHVFGGIIIKPPAVPLGFNVEYRQNFQFKRDTTNAYGNLTGGLSLTF